MQMVLIVVVVLVACSILLCVSHLGKRRMLYLMSIKFYTENQINLSPEVTSLSCMFLHMKLKHDT